MTEFGAESIAKDLGQGHRHERTSPSSSATKSKSIWSASKTRWRSHAVAREGPPRRKLGPLEVAFNANEKVKARSSTRSRAASPSIWTAPWPSCRVQPGRHPPGARRPPLMHIPQPFQILKMDKRRGNIVVSRRTVLEESRAEQRSELVQNLEEGQVIEGMVKNITDYGAFVDLGGIDGLLHVTDIAWRRVNHPSEILSIGQTVKVQIIRINQDTHRISLA
jgi:small subunit ribosomal protein S1